MVHLGKAKVQGGAPTFRKELEENTVLHKIPVSAADPKPRPEALLDGVKARQALEEEQSSGAEFRVIRIQK